MIFTPADRIEIGLSRGGVYDARAGGPERFGEEARRVWGYLQAATEAPIGLRMHPPTSPDGIPLLSALGDHPPTTTDCSSSAVTLHTSGTTGTPKPITHGLDEALQRKQPSGSDGRWLLTFAPYRWAGLSVMLHVFRSEASLVVADALTPASLLSAAKEESATHVSMTPSYLRRWQLSVGDEALRALPLKQITFGGEAATQPVLDTARDLWPDARTTHIYATTEHRDLCAISDGLAGIPDRKMSGERFAFQEDGELLIDGRPTGDLWRLESGRYHFTGRREEMINVGGAKVSPFEVEAAAIQSEGVEEARAYAVPSPLLGQMVALDYRGDADESTVRADLRGRLPKVAWPGVVNRVEQIELTEAGKTRRIER